MGTKKDIFVDAEMKFKKYTFDFLEVYTHAKDWIEWKGYQMREKKYKEIINPGDSKTYYIEWEIHKKIDNYSKYLIVLEWEGIGVKDVDAVWHGKQTKVQQGEITVKMSAYLVLDFDSNWEVHPILKFLKGFYERFLYVGTIRRNEDEL